MTVDWIVVMCAMVSREVENVLWFSIYCWHSLLVEFSQGSVCYFCTCRSAWYIKENIQLKTKQHLEKYKTFYNEKDLSIFGDNSGLITVVY